MLLTICSCDFMLWLTILERQYSMGFYCASMFECMTDQLWTRQGKPKVIKNWLAHIDPPNS